LSLASPLYFEPRIETKNVIRDKCYKTFDVRNLQMFVIN